MRVCAKKSPPSRAAWIEMPLSVSEPYQGCGSRRLHGRRGLKFGRMFCAAVATESPPSRAAWIEMLLRDYLKNRRVCRRLHGRRGLKFMILMKRSKKLSRRLHGRRGLKYSCGDLGMSLNWSPPSRAAWIEITPSEYATYV